MLVIENIKLAFRSIFGNKLRTILTFLIIAFGIMALVGILTAIDSIKASINQSFSSLGANTFTVRNAGIGARGQQSRTYPIISYREAQMFQQRWHDPSNVALTQRASMVATLSSPYRESNPNVTVMGVDENYLRVMAQNLESGRNFSQQETETAANVIILSAEMASTLFPGTDSVVNQNIRIGSIRYRVSGVLEDRGSSFGSSGNQVLIPLNNARRTFSSSGNTIINVWVDNAEDLEAEVEEATGLMRVVRKVPPGFENDFDVVTSQRLTATVISEIQYVTMAATLIGVITLIGAGIGLMNIMLVSVNERTREIGISKAIGASSYMIKMQFLTEAIVICQIGGALGILLGILAGNGVSILLSGSFILPWNWIVGGFIFCFIIGLTAGLYPAIKASRLDPIDALRYE
ncbi:MAG: FtsX-like permease family protein [Chitinophagaceae bacterium]|nr:MAG: FtsX-like permease family protein [Chitinophagaceae bacterium]